MIAGALVFLKDWRVIAGLAAITAFGIWLAFHDRAVVRNHQAKVEARAAPLREKAAAERVADAVINTRKEQELHHAIDTAPKGGTISPAAHALACQRLRNHGRVPPACRRDGGDGTKADPR